MACILAMASFLPGCGSGKPAPDKPGVTQPLRYPVLLIGQATVDVRDSEVELTTIRGASSVNLVERAILDSDGRLFRVVRAQPIAGERSILWDMGTSPRRFHVEVALDGRPSWSEVQARVVAEVRNPRSIWNGDARAVSRVLACRDAAELIEASRESWNWAR